MQVILNKFFLNLGNILAYIRLVVFEKNAKPLYSTHFNSQKITSPSRRLGYSNNQLNR